MNRFRDRKKGSMRILLLLCGLWFSYLALKDNALFNMLFSSKEMLTNKVMVTIITTISTAVPTFFAAGMFKESFLVKAQAIYYYQRLLDTKIFWILAGLLAFLLGVISLSESVLISVLNFLVGIYLVAFALNLSFRKKKSEESEKSAPLPVRGPRIIFRDQVFGLTQDFMTIGRGDRASIQIEDPEKLINPVHAGIKRDEKGQYWVIDNDSRNGTYIFSGGQYRKIKKWAIYNGDVFALCYNPAKGPYFTFQFKTD